MMRRHNSIRKPFIAALAVAFGALLVPHFAHAQAVNKTAMAGPYSVNLKVLPAEGFEGPNAPMERDGGAMPETINGPTHPNHHMVVFITKNGKHVERARVKIWYRLAMDNMMGNKGMMNGNNHGMMGEKNHSAMGGMGKTHNMNEWMKLPVVRMHVRGKGAATTHFGNNVHLAPGTYDVKVKVNGKTAMFHFSL